MKLANNTPAPTFTALHGLGYTPIPLLPGKKKPRDGAWTTRHYGPEEYDRLDRSRPPFGVGLRCGQLRGFDVDVLDDACAAEIEAALRNQFDLGDVPTRVGRAPKFLIPVRTEVAAPKRQVKLVRGEEVAKIELLGDGQQFVAAGIHPETKRPFRWSGPIPAFDELPLLDEKTLDRMIEAAIKVAARHGFAPESRTQAVNEPAFTPENSFTHQHPWTSVGMRQAEEAMRKLDPNMDRDAWIRVGLAIYDGTHGSDAGLALWDRWSSGAMHNRPVPRYDNNCAENWRSFKPPGTHPNPTRTGTLFEMANRAAFTDWTSDPMDAPTIDFGSRLIDLAALHEPAVEIPHTIDRLLPSGMTAGMFGAGKIGKSILALDMAVAIAGGASKWRDLDVTTAPVIFLSGEDVRDVLLNRLKAMVRFRRATGAPVDEKALRQNLSLLDMLGAGFSLTYADRGRTHANMAAVDNLAAWIEARYPNQKPVIIFDTLGRYDEGDESNAAYKALIHAVDALQERLGVTILVLAHVSQQSMLEKRLDMTAARGGTHIVNSMRSVMIVGGHRLGVRDDALEGQGIIPPMLADLGKEPFANHAMMLDGERGPERLGERLSVLVHTSSNTGMTADPLWFVRAGYQRAGLMLPLDFTPDLEARREEREERKAAKKEMAEAAKISAGKEAVLAIVGELQDAEGWLTKTSIGDLALKRKLCTRAAALTAVDQLTAEGRLKAAQKPDPRPRQSAKEVYRLRVAKYTSGGATDPAEAPFQ